MNPKQIWQAALGELQIEVSRPMYETYLKRTTLESQDGNVFVIGAHSTFVKEWIEERLLSRIAATLGRIVGQPVEARVILRRRQAAEENLEASPETSRPPAAAGEPEQLEQPAPPRSVAEAPAGRGSVEGAVLNPRYTFDNYIVGNSNQLAHAASRAVADNPGIAYNPLFLYGTVGLGKTHLLHAIGHEIRNRGLKVIYVTSERFTNDLIGSIREHRAADFRQRYRQAEVLLIDDIQFIAGKESTQEEFFHTFNALHEANRQIVLCSDRPPKSIATLEERLRSRFEWGLIADIQPPDFELRMAILRAKAIDRGLPNIPAEVIEYIARAAQSSIRELEGSLNRVLALANLTNRPLTLDLARAALSDLAEPAERRFITTETVVDVVARYYKLEPRALRGKARDKQIVLPRQVAMYLMRKEADCSLIAIGRELGGRDHSTVLHGYDRIDAGMEVDGRLRNEIAEITQLLYDQTRR